MPDLTQIRQQLEQRLQQLEQRAQRIERHLRTPGHPDSEENATEAENDEVLEGLGRAELQEIEEIRRALARVGDGSFGTCTGCGEPIAAGRLEALPYATLCIGCANRA